MPSNAVNGYGIWVFDNQGQYRVVRYRVHSIDTLSVSLQYNSRVRWENYKLLENGLLTFVNSPSFVVTIIFLCGIFDVNVIALIRLYVTGLVNRVTLSTGFH